MVLPSSDRWQQCVREAPLHVYSLIGRCARERSVLLQSPSMVSCRRKAISLSVRQRKRFEHTLKHMLLVTRQSRRDSAMPILRELHWLPVRHRVSYKIAELTFKALHVDLSPTYLQQCVQVYTPARSLRSVNSYTLVQNRSRTVAGDCTFVHAAATVWNALPVYVTSKDSLLSFKAALKTHLCASAYT